MTEATMEEEEEVSAALVSITIDSQEEISLIPHASFQLFRRFPLKI
jgi:hypothetical protein